MPHDNLFMLLWPASKTTLKWRKRRISCSSVEADSNAVADGACIQPEHHFYILEKTYGFGKECVQVLLSLTLTLLILSAAAPLTPEPQSKQTQR